jgi:hypothetical protein
MLKLAAAMFIPVCGVLALLLAYMMAISTVDSVDPDLQK